MTTTSDFPYVTAFWIFVSEDGFYDSWKLRDPMEWTIDDFSLKNSINIFSSYYKSSVPDGNPSEYPITLQVADMSNAYHVFGKGIFVGKMACTGNPLWIYSGCMATDELCSVLFAETVCFCQCFPMEFYNLDQ